MQYIMLLCVFLLLSLFSLSGGLESGIVGGREAKHHSRPYMASLQKKRNHVCGGMLIKEDYVLTSAHCWNETDKYSLQIVLGAHNISQKENSQQIIQVEKYIKHRKFDIMLLKLRTKAVLNHFVDIINLPKHEISILAPLECSIAGWGMKRPGEGASNVLRVVNLQLESNAKCKSKWQTHFNFKNMVCTVSDGKKAFCQGDSGSPLLCNSELYGMAAYTYPKNCTFKEYPEVYMKVSAFLPWIKKNIQ
ncbi:mast cell protease 1A isoform X1 [Danio rerio]|uniref:trypsin n=5 Tax=Danio rerio TaxID=7955 RepID=A0A8M1PUX6_DANRE|nr:mast cell protease 1A [Danio rerio]|eukprot:XP_001341145.4 mast cell protease 1A [Danio rerio]